MLTNSDYTQIFRLQSFPGDIVFLPLTNILTYLSIICFIKIITIILTNLNDGYAKKKILQNTAVRCANQFNFSEFSSVNFIPCSSLRDCKLITNRSIAAIFPGRLFLVVDSSTLKK